MPVVTQLDRLGRDAVDVSGTVAKLAARGVRVHCLALGGADLTSSAGKMTMGVINALAQFERALLIERTQSGLRPAKAQGKRPGASGVDRRSQARGNSRGSGESRDDLCFGARTSHQPADGHAHPQRRAQQLERYGKRRRRLTSNDATFRARSFFGRCAVQTAKAA